MIKLIIFDLDGVLIDAKKIHFDALNRALGCGYEITWNEHLSKYDGHKTRDKLKILTTEKGLQVDLYDIIWTNKQRYTSDSLSQICCSQQLIDCMSALKSEGYILAVCSNSISNTVKIVLRALGIEQLFDMVLSNEDVNNSKPHPEMYWKVMSNFNILPQNTLIVEDSPPGLLAANISGASVLRVQSPSEVTFVNIMKIIKNTTHSVNSVKWVNRKMNVLIPMAGAGSRFESVGYKLPKPLIDVKGSPMIQVVVNNLSIDANYIFVVQKSHRDKYNLDSILSLISPNCKIVEVDGITEGAACTALLARHYIDNDDPLFFANSDQFVEWDSIEFMYKMQETGVDGGILTFEDTHPKWSFAKVSSDGYVTEVAEKNPISDIATVGFYYWKKGSDFVKYANRMIESNTRHNNEFYVCPVFNEAIKDGKIVLPVQAKNMWGLGTPEDLKKFIDK
jgi:beta-phosphoglucomutase-like phosphatase (HAD superfamily)/dTDP-glucose pyrophosphorylase